MQRPSQNDINHLNQLLDYAIIDQSRYDTIVDELKKPSVPNDEIKKKKDAKDSRESETINELYRNQRIIDNKANFINIKSNKENKKHKRNFGVRKLIILPFELYISIPTFIIVALIFRNSSEILPALTLLIVIAAVLIFLFDYHILSFFRNEIIQPKKDNEIKKRKCSICSSSYKGTAYQQCSEECKIKFNSCHCIYCNKPFQRPDGYTRKYCSKKCCYEDSMRGCRRCGKLFNSYTGQYQDFCSKNCKKLFNR